MQLSFTKAQDQALIRLTTLLLASLTLFGDVPCFKSPDCWAVVDPKKIKSPIKIAFVAPIKRGFAPSINLSTETISVSPETYLDAVKNQFTKKRICTYRSLGTLVTKSGRAHLAQIENNAKPERTTTLQSIFIQNNRAYILTGISKVSDFPKCRKLFLQTFTSFALLDDIADFIEEEQKRKALISFQGNLPSYLKKHHEKEGTYFQLLYLDKIRDRLAE